MTIVRCVRLLHRHYRILTVWLSRLRILPMLCLAQMVRMEFTPDAVIVDFHLDDGVSGFEIIDLLRRLFSVDLPAVMITGDTAFSDSDEMMVQTVRCLSKPVGYSDLGGLVAEIKFGIDPAR